MTVTIIGTLPPITGISPTCLEQLRALSQLAKIRFINFKAIYPKLLYRWTLNENLDLNINRKSVEVLSIISWYNPWSWIKAGLLIKGKICHIHYWTFYLFLPLFTIMLVAKIRRKKIICTLHNILGHESNFFDRWLIKILLKLPDKFIVHSRHNKFSAVKYLSIKKKNLIIVPLGIASIYRNKQVSKFKAKEKLGWDKNTKVILFFGSIRKYKGVDVLIKAFSKVLIKVKNIKLAIVGEAWVDWQIYDKLIDKLILNKSVIKKIEFVPTAEVKYYFTAADILVLPYLKFEAQTAIGMIGLAFAKPMVVTKVGGLPDLVKDDRMIVEPGNINQLSKAILIALTEKNLLKKLENDSKTLAKKYSWKKIAFKTIKIYKELLK